MLCAASGFAMNAQAGTLDNYTLSFQDAAIADGAGGLGISDLSGVDKWKFTAWSVIGFQDNDASGSITAGDVYEDHIIVRFDGFQDWIGGDITPGTYGDNVGAGDNHGMTALMRFGGQVTGPNTYNVDTADPQQFDVMFDAGVGAGYTPASLAVLGSFGDGILVESGDINSGGGTYNAPVLPDGTIDVVMQLTDLLSGFACDQVGTACDPFEKDFLDLLGNPINVNMDHLFGIADGNNLAIGNPLATLAVANIDNEYATLSCPAGVCNGNFNYDFFFVTETDGSFNKVPEPGILALLGAGLMGLVGFGRRRKSA
jgi:hypothetical protein